MLGVEKHYEKEDNIGDLKRCGWNANTGRN